MFRPFCVAVAAASTLAAGARRSSSELLEAKLGESLEFPHSITKAIVALPLLAHSLQPGNLPASTPNARGSQDTSLGVANLPAGVGVDGAAPPTSPPRRPGPPVWSKNLGKLPKEWTWNIRNFKMVGYGKYGVVFKGRLRGQPEKQVAIKKIEVQDDQHKDVVKREVEIMEHLQGRPGLVTFYKASDVEAADSGDEVYIMMESATGTLQDMVIKKPLTAVTLSVRIRLFAEILHAVHDMNQGGVLHRDLKPQNILLVGDCTAEECSAVLCDLGSACSLPGGQWPSEEVSGSPSHMPPEAWEPGPADTSRDVWSLGVILFQLLAGSLPSTVLNAAQSGDYKGLITHSFNIEADPRFPLLEASVPVLASLIRGMMDPDPTTRTSLDHALQVVVDFAEEYAIDLEPRELPEGVNEWTSEPPQSSLKAFVRSWCDSFGVALPEGGWREAVASTASARVQELSDKLTNKVAGAAAREMADEPGEDMYTDANYWASAPYTGSGMDFSGVQQVVVASQASAASAPSASDGDGGERRGWRRRLQRLWRK